MTVAELKGPTHYDDASQQEEFQHIASFLQDHLGQKITAYMAGLTGHSSPKTVGRWASGTGRTSLEKSARLRAAYQVASMIIDAYGDETAFAWLFGSNSRLDDQAPASIIRNSSQPSDLENLVPVAKSFAGAAV